MTVDDMKRWIDAASYRTLLSHWRFAPVGDRFFVGEIGDYYKEKMAEKRDAVGDVGHTEASKSIGW